MAHLKYYDEIYEGIDMAKWNFEEASITPATADRNVGYKPDSLQPLKVQYGGQHYKDKPIQPIEYILANGLGFCEGNVVKYITRYADKGGIEDLQKAKHYLEFLIEHHSNT